MNFAIGIHFCCLRFYFRFLIYSQFICYSMRSTLQCKGEIIIFILQYAYLKCTYIGIAKLCCNYISTDPFVGLLLDLEWVLGTFCYFDPNCGSKSLSSNPHWLFEYWKLESFFNGFGRFKHRLYPFNWRGISFLRYINLPRKNIF